MSFLTRLKGVSSPTSPSSPTKKDQLGPETTPLQKLLADVETLPAREDGSDKYFGMENFGSTCYCNSIVQCLYYSVPFRENVISFPTRSSPETLNSRQAAQLARSIAAPNGANGALSKPSGPVSPGSPANRAGGRVGPPQSVPAAIQGSKPEDNKDSPEYKKKQALAMGPVLTMDYENADTYGMRGTLFTALKDIFEAVIAHKSRVGIVSPHKLLEILRRENEMFRTPMHQDAHEFLNLLLNEVVENVEAYSKAEEQDGGAVAMQRAVNTAIAKTGTAGDDKPGWLHDLFEGMLTSETRCLTCESISQRDEAFLDLSVDLEQHSSISSCLRKFSEEEMLCERNKFHCDTCGGLQEAEKRMKIKRLPRVLALHLKRFKYTEDLQRLQKLFHRVVYPYQLRLFNTTDDAEDPDRLYELYAVVVHIGGGPYHGHYVSIIKTEDRGWLLFDDEMVEPVDKDYVKNFFGGDNTLACAYVLFYQETTLEAMQREQEADDLAAERRAAATTDGKDLKQNGIVPNGGVHHYAIPATPAIEEADVFASLDHAATAPVESVAPSGTFEPPPLPEHISTTSSTSAGLSRSMTQRWNDAQNKKEVEKARKAQEKERKAAEKDAEKQREKEKKKLQQQQQDGTRKPEDLLQAAITASNEAYKLDRRETVVEDRKDGDGAIDTTTHASNVSQIKDRENGIMGGMFRHGSMVLRNKPKLWGTSKDRDSSAAQITPPLVSATASFPSSKPSQTSNLQTQGHQVSLPSPPPQPANTAMLSPPLALQHSLSSPASTIPTSGAHRLAAMPSVPESKKEGKEKEGKEKEEKKHRFSLGRKKSTALR